MSDRTDLKLEPGTIVEFSSGEYSDYRTIGLLVTVESIDLAALGQQFKKEHTKRDEDGFETGPDEDAFPSWLVSKHLAMPVSHQCFHVGSYGDFDLS